MLVFSPKGKSSCFFLKDHLDLSTADIFIEFFNLAIGDAFEHGSIDRSMQEVAFDLLRAGLMLQVL